ncbi:MAG: hypothetical protein IGR92_10420 [Leptolyngbyaceae cyanobacterium T60_A2020_046]|nr:hypothetical protein [Leptolyngbyaceae cyanobacterium T60_A2020_046]
MQYNFDIVGISPIWTFFKHQQQIEASRDRSCAYLGSYACTLDSFIAATEFIHQKPDWDWDAVASKIVDFWLRHEDRVAHWKQELRLAQEESLIVARVANVKQLRHELERLLDA